ncbi:MAG TPA: deoxyribodipyrimidine photo-lyase, partial [Cytophaga sp.]|nr:deoxyribodipyrimidine photo-lyase [Cytophaga sp.]
MHPLFNKIYDRFNDMNEIVVFWFRRDLRLTDNTGLYHALKSGLPVLPVFIFDTDILERLENKQDARVEFIYNTIASIKTELNALGSDMQIYHTTPYKAFEELFKQHTIKAIYTNTDYEPDAIKRDAAIADRAAENHIQFKTFKDQVIFEKDDILNDTGKPYRVYTPYKNKWLSKLASNPIRTFPSETFVNYFFKTASTHIPSLKELGFEKTSITIPPIHIVRKTIQEYDKTRDFPYIEHGTSLLGIHFRFGTISVREKVLKALPLNAVWLSELIWREFFMQILYHFPAVLTESFQTKFNVLHWRTSEEDFKKWCDGKTGYPLVDAGMREL